MTRRVFIAYDRDDREFVLRLARDLRERHVPIWIDQWNIHPGANWSKAVDTALRECDYFLIILTAASVKSDEVDNELQFARANNKTIVPVLFQACELPYYMQKYQYLDLTKRTYEDGLESLLNTLGAVSDKSAAATSSPAGEQPVALPQVRLPLEIFWSGSTFRYSFPAEHRSRETRSKYRYDSFISYAAEDRTWALRLFDDLTSRGEACFLDRSRLEPGSEWDSSLHAALDASSQLVVLWSSAAKASEWIARDVATFEVLRSHHNDGERRTVVVLLDAEPAGRLGRFQQIPHIRDAASYPLGPDRQDAAIWNDVLNHISEAADPGAVPVVLGLLATTKQEFENIDSTAAPTFGESLDAALKRLGLEKRRLLEGYGNSREQWTPLGGSPIGPYLDTLAGHVNRLIPGRMRWRKLHDVLWTNDFASFRADVVSPLSQGLGVIVVDCFSLFHPGVDERFRRLVDAVADNRDVFIAAFFPEAQPTVRDKLMQLGDRFGGRISVLDLSHSPPELITLLAQRIADRETPRTPFLSSRL